MNFHQLQKQVLQLLIDDRWCFVKFLLDAMQEETPQCDSQKPSVKILPSLDPWTQNLMGAIRLNAKDPTDSYVDYLDNKYR